MNEWKELDINNLPPDILVGDYEFQSKVGDDREYYPTYVTGFTVVEFLEKGDTTFKYRKAEPKQPTHEEIMTKWWNDPRHRGWFKVSAYDPSLSSTPYRLPPTRSLTSSACETVSKGWFTGVQSADVPPEASND